MTTTIKTTTGAMIANLCREYGIDEVGVVSQYTCGCECLDCALNITVFEIMYQYSELECITTTNEYDDIDSIAVKLSVNKYCQACTEKLTRDYVYCDELDKPEGFESVTLYHGIAAYNAEDMSSPSDYTGRVYDIIRNPEWQICCSTRPIGDIGIVVKGDVLCASNVDLYTDIEPDTGRRYLLKCNYGYKFMVSHADELDSSKWSHDEVVTRHSTVRYVWVSSSASETIKKYGQFMARLLKVKYTEVDNALQVG